DDQSRGDLGRSTLSVWSGGDRSDKPAHRQKRRRDCPTALLSRRSFSAQPGPAIIRRKPMKRTIALLLFGVLVGAAGLEAHAFLQQAEPGVGSTLQTSPNEIKIRFSEKIEPAFSNIQVFAASGKE